MVMHKEVSASRRRPRRLMVGVVALVALAAVVAFVMRDTERTVPIPFVEIGADSSMLVVYLGGCYSGGQELGLVSETSEAVTFRLTVAGDPCETTEDVVAPIELRAPLGDREILDEHTGAPVPRRD